MPHLLHLDSSARSDSFSRRLGARFAAGWRGRAPARLHLPGPRRRPRPADRAGLDGGLRRAAPPGDHDPARYVEVVHTPAQRTAWAVVAPLLDELLAADVVLIATPMYNFSVPAALKAWIDQVTFPRMSLAGRRFVVVSARGGAYGPGTPREPVDHQARYLRDFLDGHFGVTDAVFVSAELTNALVDPRLADRRDAHAASRAAAEAEVDRLAAELTAPAAA
ncbi:FMN-dependent NADH-azoreductase [Pseudonocardia nigra]|uniref:FMN-dependent NADH-azoreductase n=1 Tax=Pseudonocardia nigra TaxID=1921578 RepID=UPI0027E336A0|nr:NAD(P)H-dependent oxidoreductase [Pseudonocardia nigra]